MSEIRRLNPDEYQRLAGVADGIVPPDGSVVIVAEDAGEIVGRMILLPVVHLEGTWLAESARRGTAAGRLFDAILREARTARLGSVMAYSTSGEHDAYLHRLGFERMPWTAWRRAI